LAFFGFTWQQSYLYLISLVKFSDSDTVNDILMQIF